MLKWMRVGQLGEEGGSGEGRDGGQGSGKEGKGKRSGMRGRGKEGGGVVWEHGEDDMGGRGRGQHEKGYLRCRGEHHRQWQSTACECDQLLPGRPCLSHPCRLLLPCLCKAAPQSLSESGQRLELQTRTRKSH